MVLSLGTDVATVVATAQNVPTDVLHVVRTDVLDNDDLRAIGDETGIPLMATVAVDGPGAVAAAQQLATVADVLLLDSRHPSSGVVGASGHTHDWALSAAVVRSVDVPVILAGGLGPDNVGAAIEQVAPWGVDSETHTSFPDDRRRKDPDRVRRFLEPLGRHARTRSLLRCPRTGPARSCASSRNGPGSSASRSISARARSAPTPSRSSPARWRTATRWW